MTLEPGTTVEDTRRLESGMTRSEILALFKKRQDAWRISTRRPWPATTPTSR